MVVVSIAAACGIRATQTRAAALRTRLSMAPNTRSEATRTVLGFAGRDGGNAETEFVDRRLLPVERPLLRKLKPAGNSMSFDGGNDRLAELMCVGPIGPSPFATR